MALDLPHYIHRLPHWVYTSVLGISSKLGIYLRIGYIGCNFEVYTQCGGVYPMRRYIPNAEVCTQFSLHVYSAVDLLQ